MEAERLWKRSEEIDAVFGRQRRRGKLARSAMPFLSILFWAFFASYVVHILDETLLNGGFVKWVADNFWPTYHVRMFFWFNAAFLGMLALSNVLFDTLGGHWVILPLIF